MRKEKNLDFEMHQLHLYNFLAIHCNPKIWKNKVAVQQKIKTYFD